MAVNTIALLSLIAGIYIIYYADREKKSIAKGSYFFTGIVLSLWALVGLFGGQMLSVGLVPLAFGFFAIGAMHTKGASQAVFGAVSILLFLNIIL